MTDSRGKRIEDLLEIMARLRTPEGGCPWDLEQTFATIAPYTIEEAYEVADAIAANAPEKLRDELGDLLFQVAFHSRMAQEAGLFEFADVVAAICDKMTRRHPHVFGDATVATSAEQTRAWEEFKQRERSAEGSRSILDGIARGLPALSLASKVGKRTASVGFDWRDWRGARARWTRNCASSTRWARIPHARPRSRRNSATCFSLWSTSHAISTSTRRQRYAPATRASSSVFGISSSRRARADASSRTSMRPNWTRSGTLLKLR
jgi:uncharacterized protein YabN with tetrapyrrole methylase and pyrophosphatase domain